MNGIRMETRLDVCWDWIAGYSYDEIVKRRGVARGSVSNILKELRSGQLAPADIAEHAEALRRISLEFREAGLDPAEAAIGLGCFRLLNSTGLAPLDWPRWLQLGERLSHESELATARFCEIAVDLHKPQEGIDDDIAGAGDYIAATQAHIDDVHRQVTELEERKEQLGHVSGDLENAKHSLADVELRKSKLDAQVAGLTEREALLFRRVRELEKRDSALMSHVESLESKGAAEERRLAQHRAVVGELDAIGLTPRNLRAFFARVSAVAERHRIAPSDLEKRLLAELESLDEGLTLDETVRERSSELRQLGRSLGLRQRNLAALEAETQRLEAERDRLEGEARALAESVPEAIRAVLDRASQSVQREETAVRDSVAAAVAEFRTVLAEGAKLYAELQSQQWLQDLLAVAEGADPVPAVRLRTLGLTFLAPLAQALKSAGGPYMLPSSLELLISEVAQWRPTTH